MAVHRRRKQAPTDRKNEKELMARKITTNHIAPDFTLNDFNSQPVQLSSFRGKRIVLLVFNRGFV
jgi:peroxiredoxin